MPLSILTFASGDTDYIAKHNTNNTNIKAAIDALQSAIGGLGGEGTTAVFYEGIFSSANALIGSGSYLPSDSATAHQLDVAAGFAYVESADAVVTKSIASALSFSGQTTGTFYIHVDSNGEPSFNGTSDGALYSVYYDSASGDFSQITRVGNMVEAAADQDDARTNLWSIQYDTLDKRIDGSENAALSILQQTAVATDLTLTDQEAFEHHVLLVNDGPQTANININVPASERVYTVLNNADSNYHCTILPDGGTGYDVVGNYFAILHCDGSTVTPIFLLDRTTGVSPSQEFTGLSDTPNSYAGQAGKMPRVNTGATALEFIAVQNTPATGETTVPVSSAWAYTHEQAADPHPGYLTPAEGNAAYEPLDATILKEADVDDTPVDAATTAPISSNWAFDHENASDPHPGYLTQAEADAIYEDDLGNPASDGQHLVSTAAGVRSWEAVPAGGDVTGPASAVDSNIALFDGTTGKLIKDSGSATSDFATSGHNHSGVYEPADATIVKDGDFTANGAMERTGAGAYTTILNKRDATVAPTTGDDNLDGYSVGSRWIDITNDKEYVCLDATTATAVWTETTGGGTGGGGFSTVSDQVDQATVAAAVDTLYIVTTGATNGTCTVNLPSPTGAGDQLGVVFHAENTDTDKVVISPAASDEIDGSTADIELTAPGEYLYLHADGDGTNWYTYSSTSSGTAGTAAGVGSGSMQFIEKKTYSGASEATVDLTGYDSFVIRVVNYVPGTDSTNLYAQVSEDGGSTWKSGASDYQWAVHYGGSGNTSGVDSSANDSKMQVLGGLLGTATGEIGYADINVSGLSNGSWKHFNLSAIRTNHLGVTYTMKIGGTYKGTTNDINALRIYPESGTFSCSIVVYGIAEDHERFGVSSQFSGAMVKLTADDTAVNASTNISYTWDAAEYDVGSWWSAGNPTRLTVPSGVSRVRISCAFQVGLLTADSRVLIGLQKNGASFDMATYQGSGDTSAASLDHHISYTTGVLEVVEGDYFEARLYCDDTSVTVSATNGTHFSIEAVGLVGTTIDKAKAYLSTAANTTNGTAKVPIDATSYDTGGIFDTTNDRFIPTKAGYYSFSGQIYTSTSGNVNLYLYKNGASEARLGGVFNSAAYGVGGSTLVYCNGTTDYLELYLTSTSVRAYGTTAADTYMTIYGPVVGTAQGSTDYLMSGFYPGAPTASAKMMVHAFAAGVTVDAAMAGSQGTAETAATAQTDFDVQKNGVSAGTMRFAAAATTATFIMATATSFSPGDKLQLIAPATPDATLADIAWSFKGNKA